MSQSPRTPGAIIGAAIIMFIYGGLLLMCVLCSGLGLVVKDPGDPMGLEAMMDKEAPGHQIIQIGSVGFNFLFAISFFACGLGILWLNQIARFGTYLICLGVVLVTAAGAVYNVVYLFPIQERAIAQHMQAQGPAPFDINALMKGSMAAGLCIAIGIPFVFCLPIMILISVKSARMAFAGQYAPALSDDDDYHREPREPNRDDGYGSKRRSDDAPPDTGFRDHS
jgi:hypothetical protein